MMTILAMSVSIHLFGIEVSPVFTARGTVKWIVLHLEKPYQRSSCEQDTTKPNWCQVLRGGGLPDSSRPHPASVLVEISGIEPLTS